MDILLSSSSPRRKELLEQIGLKFSVCENEFNEIDDVNLKPKKLVLKNAIGKATYAKAQKTKWLLRQIQ